MSSCLTPFWCFKTSREQRSCWTSDPVWMAAASPDGWSLLMAFEPACFSIESVFKWLKVHTGVGRHGSLKLSSEVFLNTDASLSPVFTVLTSDFSRPDFNHGWSFSNFRPGKKPVLTALFWLFIHALLKLEPEYSTDRSIGGPPSPHPHPPLLASCCWFFFRVASRT